MEYLFTRFGQLFLKYPDKDEADIINSFYQTLNPEEKQFYDNYCVLFLQLIDTVKDAPEGIKKKILSTDTSRSLRTG